MTTAINTRYLKMVFLFMMTIFSLLFVRRAFAADASTSATSDPVKRYGITFPVSELGGCNNLDECRAYCADSTHSDACIAFAKSHGFYKAPTPRPADASQSASLKDAQTELGCSSASACKAFCALAENHDKCSSFAMKHHLGPPPRPESAMQGAMMNKTLEEAKTILGCASADECRTFCQNPDNRQKCEDFAKQAGLGGPPRPASESGLMRPQPRGSFPPPIARRDATPGAYPQNRTSEYQQYHRGPNPNESTHPEPFAPQPPRR